MASAEAAPDLKRIDEIIRNSRALWFVLNGALVFAGITLASVQDIAFFVTSERTQLPLVGIDVPVTYFFWAGALLIASFYIYFHLYLEQLWQALGEAPARIGGKLLSERIHPWIVADAALRFRDRLRKAEGEERASRPRGMGLIGNLATIGLVWLFGLQIVAWFWWRSMPAHDPLMTGWLAIVLAATLGVFCTSVSSAWEHLGKRKPRHRWRYAYVPLVLVVAGLTVVRTSYDWWEGQPRTDFITWPNCARSEAPDVIEQFLCSGSFRMTFDVLRPARANLREVEFAERPSDWLPHQLAKAEFRVRWCRENAELDCINPLSPDKSRVWDDESISAFQRIWQEHRSSELVSLPKPDLRGRDLRGADLSGAGLEGVNFSGVNLEGARFAAARLEGADFSEAEISTVDFSDTDLRMTKLVHRFSADELPGVVHYPGHAQEFSQKTRNIRGARMAAAKVDGVDLYRADLSWSDLSFASLVEADLEDTTLTGVIFVNSVLKDANLTNALLEVAHIEGANLQDANLSNATLHGANLLYVDLEEANLDRAKLNGARIRGEERQMVDLGTTSLWRSSWDLAALRFVDLREVDLTHLLDFGSTFLDGSVSLPSGTPRRCQWADRVLDDDEYFGSWRGWLEFNEQFVPADLRQHETIRPISCMRPDRR